MSQSALAGGPSGLPADLVTSMHTLAGHGFRVFPVEPGGKRPHSGVKSWAAFDTEPDHALIERFRRLPTLPNIGLICSEHLIVIDVDNLDFAAWFDAQGPERLGTWIVRTPSGGTHIYLRSVEAIATTVLKSARGTKIGDVKARGGYVVAPPSVGANGDYETEYGDPALVVEQQNALEWFFRTYVVPWDNSFPVRLEPSVNGDQYASTVVQDPPPAEVQEQLAAELRTALLGRKLHDYVYATLIVGTSDHWKDPDDHSGVDFGCIKDLIGLGWSFQQIEAWYAFSPIGEWRYRGQDKSRGRGYLLRTYDKASEQHEIDSANLKNATGGNFRIYGPVEKFDVEGEAIYRLYVEWNTDQKIQSRQITLPSVAFNTPQRFLDACARQGLHLDMGNFDTKDKLRGLAFMVENLAEDSALPEAATLVGLTVERLRRFVNLNVAAQSGVLEARAFREQGYVYVNPNTLHDYMATMRPTPKPNEVWDAWVTLGGGETSWQGRRCWRAPATAFPGLV